MFTIISIMKGCTVYLALVLVASSYSSAIPPQDKERVVDKKLSDAQHEVDGEHNNDYDHDAFLGHDQAEQFDDLSPEESLKRLGELVDKIDDDHDNFVTEEELIKWIQYVQKRYVTQDTERMWKDHETKSDRLIWEDYKQRTYGYAGEEEEEVSSYKKMQDRDKRRWNIADKDGDGQLSKEEFADFLHPEEAEHMKDIVVQETIEDIDKDGDGFISLEEYIADIYDEEDEDDDDEDADIDEDKDGEPDWVTSERDQFKFHRDMDGDGKLDQDEVRHWVIPEDYDHSREEARHLMRTSDEDKDGKLTKQEILDKHDIFVGSQATEFGEALTKHDEF